MNRERILRCLCKYLEDAAYLGMSSQKQSGPVDEESVPDFQLTYGNFGAKQVSKKGMLGNLKTLLGKEILYCHKDIKKNDRSFVSHHLPRFKLSKGHHALYNALFLRKPGDQMQPWNDMEGQKPDSKTIGFPLGSL